MEAVALAVTPHLAITALVLFHPFSVAVDLVVVLPYVPEAVFVNVALMVVASDAETARDGTVCKDGCNVDAGTTRI